MYHQPVLCLWACSTCSGGGEVQSLQGATNEGNILFGYWKCSKIVIPFRDKMIFFCSTSQSQKLFSVVAQQISWWVAITIFWGSLKYATAVRAIKVGF